MSVSALIHELIRTNSHTTISVQPTGGSIVAEAYIETVLTFFVSIGHVAHKLLPSIIADQAGHATKVCLLSP